MADDRYGGYARRDGWRESSIFSDDDDDRRRRNWRARSGGYDRERERGRDEERGFFDRAGDEVRSWFGDEEAERRREMDIRRDDARSAFGGREYERRYGGYGRGTDYATPGGYGSTYGGRTAYDRGGREYETGRALHRSFSRETGGYGGSQWDPNYREWRDRQIEQLDREYDEYCRERQQQFEQDFDSWRSSRLTEGGTSGTAATGTSRTSTGGAATGATATGASGAGTETTRGRGTRTGA